MKQRKQKNLHIRETGYRDFFPLKQRVDKNTSMAPTQEGLFTDSLGHNVNMFILGCILSEECRRKKTASYK